MSQEEPRIEQDFTMLDDELLDAIGDAVAISESGGWHNIGKLTIGMTRFGKWQTQGESRVFVELTKEQFFKAPANEQAVDFVFSIDVKELRPDSLYGYSRRVSFKSADWRTILVPSFEEVLGAGALASKDQAYKTTFRKLQGAYVDMIDVPQAPQKGKVPTNPNTGKPYMTCKLFKVFTDKTEAQKAVDDRRKTIGDNGATPALDLTNIPAEWVKGDAAKYESSVASMFKETVRQVGLLGMKGGAIKVKILNSEGQPNLNQQNQPIDAVTLLSRILDTPEPMIDLS